MKLGFVPGLVHSHRVILGELLNLSDLPFHPVQQRKLSITMVSVDTHSLLPPAADTGLSSNIQVCMSLPMLTDCWWLSAACMP